MTQKESNPKLRAKSLDRMMKLTAAECLSDALSNEEYSQSRVKCKDFFDSNLSDHRKQRGEQEACEADQDLALLNLVEAKVLLVQNRIDELRKTRISLSEELKERLRKLYDYKGKIPRSLSETSPAVGQAGNESVTPALGTDGPLAQFLNRGMPCARVCTYKPNGDGGAEPTQGMLCFEQKLERGISSIDGFSKLWILSLLPAEFSTNHPLMRDSSLQTRTICEPEESRIRLTIADLLNVKGSQIEISGYKPLHDEELIVDIKPYLSYSDAWPPSDAGNQA